MLRTTEELNSTSKSNYNIAVRNMFVANLSFLSFKESLCLGFSNNHGILHPTFQGGGQRIGSLLMDIKIFTC